MKEIVLTQGKKTIIDDATFDYLNQFKWHASRRRDMFYAYRRIGSEKIAMHRILARPPEGYQVDHINMNGLDNRIENLRVCTNSENNRNIGLKKSNVSGFKGVYWDKERNKWQAQILINRKHIYLGRFEEIIDAAAAYDKKAIELFGTFARTNKSMGLLN